MTTLFCIANCNPAYAQIKQPDVQIVERLDDNSFILTIDGAKYRAINAEQMKNVQQTRINYEFCTEENSNLTAQNEKLRLAFNTSRQNLDAASEQINLEKLRGDKFSEMYESEKRLREQAEKLPRSQNALEKIFGNPIVQTAIVVVAGAVAAKAVHK